MRSEKGIRKLDKKIAFLPPSLTRSFCHTLRALRGGALLVCGEERNELSCCCFSLLEQEETIIMSTRPPPSNKTPNPRPKKKLKMRKGNVDIRPRKSLITMVLASMAKGNAEENQDNVIVTPDQKKKQSSPIEMLPDEVLGQAFCSGFVNSIEIIKNVTMVSKRTRQVANKSVKMLDLRALPNLEASDVASIVSRHGNLSSLDFGYCPQFGREHLMALVPVSSTLRILCLRGSCIQDDDIVAYLNAVMEHLGGKPSGLEVLDLSAIKKEENPRIGDVAVSKIAVRCKHTKHMLLLCEECMYSRLLLFDSLFSY